MKEKDKYHVLSLMCDLKQGANEPIQRQKQTYRHGEQTCGCQGGAGEVGWTGSWGQQMQTITFRVNK